MRSATQAPNNTRIRFALADALISLKRHAQAVEVLRQGLRRYPGDQEIKHRLVLAESYLEEQQWIEKRRGERRGSTQHAVEGRLDTRTRLHRIRCTKLKGRAALEACDTALRARPDDPLLHRQRGDALLDVNQIADAILAYQEALRLDPSSTETPKRIKLAQAQRQSSAKKCRQLTGRAALAACEAALLRGANDEALMQERRGDILLHMKRSEDAIRAYRAALSLAPDNADIQRKVLALTRQAAEAASGESSQQAAESMASLSPTPPAARGNAPETKPASATRTATKAVRKSQEPALAQRTKSSRTEASQRDTAAKADQAEKAPKPAARATGTSVKDQMTDAEERGSGTPIATIAVPVQSSAPSSRKRYSNRPIAAGITH